MTPAAVDIAVGVTATDRELRNMGEKRVAMIVDVKGRSARRLVEALLSQTMLDWATRRPIAGADDDRLAGFDGKAYYRAQVTAKAPPDVDVFQRAMMYLSTHDDVAAVTIGDTIVWKLDQDGNDIEGDIAEV